MVRRLSTVHKNRKTDLLRLRQNNRDERVGQAYSFVIDNEYKVVSVEAKTNIQELWIRDLSALRAKTNYRDRKGVYCAMVPVSTPMLGHPYFESFKQNFINRIPFMLANYIADKPKKEWESL